MEAIRKKFKRTKAPILEDGIVDEEESTNSDRPLISPVEQTPHLNPNSYGSIDSNDVPSAPPVSFFVSDVDRDRRLLMRNMFYTLAGQQTLLSVLAALFVYVPHLRKIFRKNIFDKLFLTSYIGYPLCVVIIILLFAFPKLRKKFAWSLLVVITSCLSMLLSYVMTVGNANAFMMSVFCTDACSLGAVGGSYLPRIDLTSRKTLFFYPTFMLTTSAIYPSFFPSMSYRDALIPSAMTTLIMTHIGLNARDILRDTEELNLKPSDYAYGVTQLYLKPSFYNVFRKILPSRNNDGYHRI